MKKIFISGVLSVLALVVTPISVLSQDSGHALVNAGILNGKAIRLPMPAYPAPAQAVNASGEVRVEVLVDENGSVLSATATSGHPLLRGPAVEAAKNAKFPPTLANYKPVRIIGIITYSFASPQPAPSNPDFTWFATSMTLGSLQKVGSDPALKLSAAQNSRGLPNAFSEEKQLLSELPSVAGLRQTEIIDGVISAFEKKLSGDDLWQFEIGKLFGQVIGQAKMVTVNRNFRVDEAEFRATMARIAELAYSAPSEIPSDIVEKFKKFAALVDRSDLKFPELMINTLQSGVELIKLTLSKANFDRREN